MIQGIKENRITGDPVMITLKSFTGYFTLFIFLVITACEPKTGAKEESSAPQKENNVRESIQSSIDSGAFEPPESAQQQNYNLLGGDWIRADGGYTLILRDISSNGTLKASYFNPKEIHVGKSSWSFENNNIIVTVELKDINYPGSTYTLKYYQNEDKLAGNYFQAVEGANYDVMFTRK